MRVNRWLGVLLVALTIAATAFAGTETAFAADKNVACNVAGTETITLPSTTVGATYTVQNTGSGVCYYQHQSGTLGVVTFDPPLVAGNGTLAAGNTLTITAATAGSEWIVIFNTSNYYVKFTVTAPVAGLTPTFDTPVSTADGFIVNVTNYDADYTWTPTAAAGTVTTGTASGSTLPLTVTGLPAGNSDTVTVTTSRTGYTDGTADVTGTALSSALTPTFDTPVSTADGFIVNVTNYDADYTWTPTAAAGTVTTGTASGSTLPLTVTGLPAGNSDTVTVTTSRTGYTDGTADVTGTALSTRASAAPSPSALSFGGQEVGTTSGTQTVTITSSGTSDLEIGADATSLGGSDAAMFTIEADACSGRTLAPSETCTIGVSFTPTSSGAKSATLTVASNDPSSPTSVLLTGGETSAPLPARFTFQFTTPAGGTCLPSVQVTDGQVFALPGTAAACVATGSTLVGWSIPGQDWDFAPAGRVVVSGDQVFTAVALNPDVEITFDANVGMETPCLTAGGSSADIADRSETVRVMRTGDVTLPTTAPCSPAGFRLIGWTDENTPDGSGQPRPEARSFAPGSPIAASWSGAGTRPINTVRLYALWQRG